MRRVWRNLTRNDDGSPLFGFAWLAPVMVVATVAVVVYDLFS